MKTLLYVKYADIAVQLMALIIPAVAAVIYNNSYFLLFCYVTTVGVQTISCILNALLLNTRYKHGFRLTYQALLITIIVIIVVSVILWWMYCVYSYPILWVLNYIAVILVSIGTVVAFPLMIIAYLSMSVQEVIFIRNSAR